MSRIQTATGLATSAESIIDSFGGILERAFQTSPTKEQAIVTVAVMAGTVAVYAIKSGYDFEYDGSRKALTFRRRAG